MPLIVYILNILTTKSKYEMLGLALNAIHVFPIKELISHELLSICSQPLWTMATSTGRELALCRWSFFYTCAVAWTWSNWEPQGALCCPEPCWRLPEVLGTLMQPSRCHCLHVNQLLCLILGGECRICSFIFFFWGRHKRKAADHHITVFSTKPESPKSLGSEVLFLCFSVPFQ